MKIVALAGLPGTGKSTLAKLLAERLGAPLLDKDRARAALFAPEEIEYSREQDDLVVACLYHVVEFHARRGRVPAVVLDGRTYSKRTQVEGLRQLAGRAGATLCLIECTAPAEVARARLERERGTHPAANRDAELYDRLSLSAEPIPEPKLVLDTSRATPRALAEAVLAHLGLD